jgi:phosphohistidine phosphatase
MALSKEEDPERPLSPEGRQKLETAAQAIRQLELKVDIILTSTQKRAVQSAEIVAAALDCPLESIIDTTFFKPSAAPVDAVHRLEKFKNREALFIVGHLPSLAGIASQLLLNQPGLSINFQNGGLALIEVETLPSQVGVLQWYLPPEILQRLGGK